METLGGMPNING